MIHQPFKILLYLFFPLSILAQSNNYINIVGNSDISTNQISAWLEEQNNLVDTNIVKTNLYKKLSEVGYYNSSIRISNYKIDSTNIYFDLHIFEGNPTYIKNIIHSGLDSLQTFQIEEQFSFLINQILIKNELEEALSNVISDLEINGYPFVSIKISSINFYKMEDDNFADVYLIYDLKEIQNIDVIRIEGNDKTKENVIIREIGINIGDKYNQEIIDDIPTRLNKLQFFNSIDETIYFKNNNKGILQIRVKEAQTNNFDGIIGYVPSTNDNESGFFTGFLNISLRNLFGTGRAAAIKWKQENRNSQELELKYLEPWVFNFPINFNAELYQRKQDTTYVQRKIKW